MQTAKSGFDALKELVKTDSNMERGIINFQRNL